MFNFGLIKSYQSFHPTYLQDTYTQHTIKPHSHSVAIYSHILAHLTVLQAWVALWSTQSNTFDWRRDNTTHTHAGTHARTHAHTHARTHARTHTHAHARSHARKHSLTHSLTHTHTYACTHAHARTYASREPEGHITVFSAKMWQNVQRVDLDVTICAPNSRLPSAILSAVQRFSLSVPLRATLREL